MTDFKYQEMFPVGEDKTEYRLLTQKHISSKSFEDNEILKIAPEGLELLAEQAFRDVSHLLRPSHLKLLLVAPDTASTRVDCCSTIRVGIAVFALLPIHEAKCLTNSISVIRPSAIVTFTTALFIPFLYSPS